MYKQIIAETALTEKGLWEILLQDKYFNMYPEMS